MKNLGPPEWNVERLLDLLEPDRRRVWEILQKYQVEGPRALEILSGAWISATGLTRGTMEERLQVFVDSVEHQCRETRAWIGPSEEEEKEPHVH